MTVEAGPTLLVDIGNSRVKWVLADGVVRRGAASTCGDNEWQGRWAALERPAGVVLSSVASRSFDEDVERWCRARWQVSARFVSAAGNGCGVTNGYQRPSDLGSDRWAALVGARDLHGGPCVVVDCGTAVTVDSLDPTGRFPGGVIIPGVDTLAQALLARTARLCGPFAWHPDPIGRTTAEGISAGATNAVLGGIVRAIEFLDRRYGAGALTVFVTGGQGALVAPLLDRPVRLEPDLVLHGLALLSESFRSES